MSVAKIALRNLSRQRRRTFLLGGAIAFGVLAATLVNGFTGGLINNIEANVSKMVAGHIYMTSVFKDEKNRTVLSMENNEGIDAAVKALKYPVRFTQKRTETMATLVFETTSIGRSVDGVDWKNDRFLTEDLKLSSGSLADLGSPKAVLLSKKQADKLGIKIGEKVFIQVQTIHGQQNYDEFTVKAVYDDSNDTMNANAYISIEDADQLIDMMPGTFNVYGITLERFGDTDQATADLMAGLPKNLNLMDRSKVAGKGFRDVLEAFHKDKKNKGPTAIVANVNDELAGIKGQIMAVNALALVVLVILLAVVMVGLTNTYRIIVYERSREIGTMRAMGMQRKQVQRIFVLEAVFLSLGGALAGILTASVILTGLSLIPFGKSDNSALAFILSNGHLTWHLDLVTLVVTTGLVAGMTWLAALMPARRAGKVDPAVALRTTA